MRKGQAAGAIIAILIIAVVLIFVFMYYKPTTNHKVEYKNDIVTIEETIVSNSNPSPGSTTSVSLLVKNNGDKPVDAEVNFDNIAGLDFKELYCESGRQEFHACIFEGIDPLDTRNIILTLKVPEETISNPFVEYYVKYTYSGYRKADIPIVDNILRTPLAKFSQSEPSIGPVVLEFEFPAQKEIRKDSQVIKEYWVVANNPFELKIKLRHVGTLSGVEPIIIKKDSLVLDLKNNFRVSQGLKCDFEERGGKLYLNEDVELPEELKCNLETTLTPEPETTGTIWAEFTYDYQYRRKESFTVKTNV